MTLFEYLAIAFSLLLSASAMRLVEGLPHTMREDRRYWIHLGFVCAQLLNTVLIFWVFWSFRTVEWTLPTFALALVNPGLVYYAACVLVPDDPDEVDSWRDYYYAVRTHYFAGITIWAVALIVISHIVLDIPWIHPARAPQMVLLVIGAVGAASASPRVHAGLVVVLLGMAASVAPILAYRPGALTP